MGADDARLLAMCEEGHWFLSDEFNLADPNILAVLAPILEKGGSLRVPGRGKVHPRPGFRFFATQNDASYKGRNKLPATLRARFLEAQVQDFSEQDIQEIFEKKLAKMPHLNIGKRACINHLGPWVCLRYFIAHAV